MEQVIYINLTNYQQQVRYRDHSNIDSNILEKSSLSANQTEKGLVQTPVLIAGVGRSGTTFICTFLNKLGWDLSHDNNVDCGNTFPGSFGAVSWYHSFAYRFPRRANGSIRNRAGGRVPIQAQQVILVVRDPLAVIKSRLARTEQRPVSFNEFYNYIEGFENHNLSLSSLESESGEYNYITWQAVFMLRHWVHRNSFVSQHAQWYFRIEDMTNDPLTTWMLCLEVQREDCPELRAIRKTLGSMDGSINNNGKIEGYDQSEITWWERLAAVDEEYVRIALKMADEYGLLKDRSVKTRFGISNATYSCAFTEDRLWSCSLT